MKNTTRSFLFSLVGLVIVSIAHGAVPAMDVVVTNASNKEVYKGKTDGSGNFATGEVEPGNYVVQINSTNSAVKGSTYGIMVTAGKANSAADAVPGEKIAGNGVALRIAAAARTKITGRVNAGGTAAPKGASTASATNPEQKTKMMNGKKFIWVPSDSHTMKGAHWAEEGSEPAATSGSPKPGSTTTVRPSSGGRY